MFQVKILLHPTDFSEYSDEAHAIACEMARDHKARLVVLHVTDKPVISYIEKSSELNPDQIQQKLWETLQWPRVKEADLNVEHRITEGDALTQILSVAKEIGCHLIVMGSSGRKGLFAWFTNSVTEQVDPLAPCSILVVKSLEVQDESYPRT